MTTLTDSDGAAIAMIATGYGDPHGAMHFRVAVSAGVLAAALDAIGDYNGFDPPRVLSALRVVVERCAPWRIAIGRENSPVVYLWIDDIDDTGPVAAELYVAGADEITFSDGVLRAWWD